MSRGEFEVEVSEEAPYARPTATVDLKFGAMTGVSCDGLGGVRMGYNMPFLPDFCPPPQTKTLNGGLGGNPTLPAATPAGSSMPSDAGSGTHLVRKLIQSLCQQRDSIYLQQQYLQGMSRNLDSVLEGLNITHTPLVESGGSADESESVGYLGKGSSHLRLQQNTSQTYLPLQHRTERSLPHTTSGGSGLLHSNTSRSTSGIDGDGSAISTTRRSARVITKKDLDPTVSKYVAFGAGDDVGMQPTQGEVSAAPMDQEISLMFGGDSDPNDPTRKLVERLQARLDIRNTSSFITAVRLHKSLRRLGLSKYTVHDITRMVIAVVEHLKTLPDVGDTSILPNDSTSLPFGLFARVLLVEVDSAPVFTADVREMLLTCREILLSGDANRIVAELTQVNVDELAQPVQVDRISDSLEPVVNIVILVNAAIIGVQADKDLGDDDSWFWVDSAFTIIFLSELLIKGWVRGIRWFFKGTDWLWNYFDSAVVCLGLVDMLLTAFLGLGQAASTFTVLRVIRIARLTRLFRVFRLKQMKELSLMLAGVVAGLRTLLWAIILLFFCIYILGIFATSLLRDDTPPLIEGEVFDSVPVAMFTVFRCLMGDCEDKKGRPLIYSYAEVFGVPFVLAYVAVTVFIIFGVFNLIFAIYIETTLAAAKTQRKMDRKEAVRVARITRELLKKFAVADSLLKHQDAVSRETYGDTKEFRKIMRRSSTNGEIKEGNLLISRDVFSLVLKDPGVQALMDSLDISQERTHLFDILDADGSGDVEASELIQGLLRVRGEAKKSDVVANLLAVRAVQNMIRKMDRDHRDFRREVTNALSGLMEKCVENNQGISP